MPEAVIKFMIIYALRGLALVGVQLDLRVPLIGSPVRTATSEKN
jgi:hypothetical protein